MTGRETPSPSEPLGDRKDVYLAYLTRFRSQLLEALAALPEADLGSSRLPSGWTPLELLHHLTLVEHRWLEWGFEGRQVESPWADWADGRPGTRWRVPDGAGLASLTDALHQQAARSEAVIAAHSLDEVGRPGPRWDGEPPATLERTLLHLTQEYARHLGHLDIVVETAGSR